MADELARQPGSWRQARGLAGQHASALPAAGERVAVAGCGTSWFMAEAYAALREDAGQGETDAFAASEFPAARDYDRLLVISRSGTTTEVIRLLDAQRGRLPRTLLTADAGTPAARLADHVIELAFADERSVVQTLFATTALAVLRDQLGHDLAALAHAAERVLVQPLPASWLAAEQITFLGSGWAHGIAREAALKLREAAQFWTESYPSMEYRHGPISIAGPGRLVWQFGPDQANLGPDVAATGAEYYCGDEDPLAELILAQRLAAALAERAGLDPDHPRQLTRSVVLDPQAG